MRRSRRSSAHLAISERNPMILGTLAGAYARGGHLRAGARNRRRADLAAKDALCDTGSVRVRVHGTRRTRPGVRLARARLRGADHIMKFIGVNPIFDPVRADPRFVDLVRRVGSE